MKTPLDIVNIIEKELNVEEWKFEKVYIWPLYRFYIHTKIRASKASFKNVAIPKLKRIVVSLFSIKVVLNTIIKLSKVSNIDVIFLSNSSFKRFKKNDKWVDPYVHPVAKKLSDVNLTYQIIETDLIKNRKGKSLIPTINIDDLINFIYFFVAPIFLIRSVLIYKFKNNFSFSKKVNEKLTKNNILLEIPKDMFFIKQLSNLKAKAFIFKIILKRINPGFGVITGYGSQEGLSFCLACHDLNIKSIELQHGGISEEMPRYGKWKKVPTDGYEVLPNIFWCWNEYDYKFLTKWTEKSKKHNVKMNGNFFIRDYKNYLDNKANLMNKELSKKVNHFEKFILFALQAEEWQPEWLIEEILNQNSNILWGFRFHPSYYDENREFNLKKQFQQKGLTNYDFDIVNDPSMNILNCIDLSDSVMSAFSSSLLESVMLKKHTGIIHKEGLEHYKNYVDEQKIHLVNCPSSFNIFVNDLVNDRLTLMRDDAKEFGDEKTILKEVFNNTN